MKQALNYTMIVEEIKANRNYQFREELDSELEKLYEAMQTNNDEMMNKSKKNLLRIRRELIDLNENFGQK